MLVRTNRTTASHRHALSAVCGLSLAYAASVAAQPVIPIIGGASGRAVQGGDGVLDVDDLPQTDYTIQITLPAAGDDPWEAVIIDEVFLALVFEEITIPAGYIVRFANPPGWNSPIHLLATGPVRIDGYLLVNGGAATRTSGGVGGPGGYRGGDPSTSGADPATAEWGSGPGGGAPFTCDASDSDTNDFLGGGAYSVRRHGKMAPTAHDMSPLALGNPYGSPLLVPLVGGSGGGGVRKTGDLTHVAGGSGGGGAILVASDTSITVSASGLIQAAGGATTTSTSWYCKSPGSGGAIRLVAPEVSIEGANGLSVRGGYINHSGNIWYGSPGRVRIDALNSPTVPRSAVEPTLSDFSPSTSTVGHDDPATAAALVFSTGSYLVAFPTQSPRIVITSVGGTTIDNDTPKSGGAVFVVLEGPDDPVNPTNRDLVFNAVNVTGEVVVVVTPRLGDRPDPRVVCVDNSPDLPAVRVEDVDIPANVLSRIDIWTVNSTCTP